MKLLKQGISDVLGLFFPDLCVCCGDRLITQEKHVCFACWNDLPLTNFHFKKDNKVAQLFWGRTQIENATAFFSYKKGSKYQHLIHFVKYKGLKDLGYETGRKFGFTLLDSDSFRLIDGIIPVPLHPKKKKLRGFNQSEYIARGLANVLKKPLFNENLVRKTHTSTQTRKNRFERWQNVEDIFELKNSEEIEGKHILLVDDVVTTGSTLEACACQLLKLPGVQISVATLAYADI